MIVAAIMGGVVAIYLLNMLYGSSMTKLKQNYNRELSTNKGYQASIDHAELISPMIEKYASKSLPLVDKDGKDARETSSSRYQNWLIEITDRSGLRDRRVDRGSIREVKKGRELQYCIFQFTLRGTGNLAQVTELLKQFYEVDHYHNITSLSLKPTGNGSVVDLSAEVHAIGLPQTHPSEKFEMAKKAAPVSRDAIASVVNRKFFEVYTPPRVERPPTPITPRPPEPRFDITPFSFLTAVLDVDGRSEAWIDIRTEGKRLKLREGENFQLGRVSCVLHRINEDSVDVEAANKMFRIHLGKAFAEATVLGDAPVANRS